MWSKTGATDKARAQAGPCSSIPWQEWLFQGQACDSFQAKGSEAQSFYGIVETEYFFSVGSERM